MCPTLSTETARHVVENISNLLKKFTPDTNSPLSVDVQQAVFLARQMQNRATALQTAAERRQQSELDRMIQSPRDKVTLMQLTDQAFRSRLPHRAADQMIHILDVQGVPRFFSTLRSHFAQRLSVFGCLPARCGHAVGERKDAAGNGQCGVACRGGAPARGIISRQRWEEGVRMNVNLSGRGVARRDERS